MSQPDLLARLRASYAAATLTSAEARIAAAVTLTVALAVLALARVPLHAPLDVDFRAGDRVGGAVQTTLVGFSAPDGAGRRTLEPFARVVFNRPLPDAFVLQIEARMEGDPDAALEVEVGGERHALRLEPGFSRRELRVRNPGGAREIGLRVAAGTRLVIQSLGVRPGDGLG